ncbi:MAG TPA: DUF805 domain-containing protein [Allosphingosinicella sp.]|nr:DUF805 domain-containing protein [Allosphingosinicella sp.]
MIVASIRHNLANLLRFSGRESRALFWPYALVIVLLDFIAMWAAMIPQLADSVARSQRFVVEHPELVVRTGPGSVQFKGPHPELMPDLAFVGHVAAAIALIGLLLLAAAVARRLHDRCLHGWWGVLPLPFLGFGLVMMPRVFTSIRIAHATPDVRLVMTIFLNNLLYLAALAILVILLIGEGTRGPNRFGDGAPAV